MLTAALILLAVMGGGEPVEPPEYVKQGNLWKVYIPPGETYEDHLDKAREKHPDGKLIWYNHLSHRQWALCSPDWQLVEWDSGHFRYVDDESGEPNWHGPVEITVTAEVR